MSITNLQLWNSIRKNFPQFRSHTSEGTADLFTERGFNQLMATDAHAIDEWFELSVRTYLVAVNVQRVKDPLEIGGFGETFEAPFGAIIQKMSTGNVTPVSPAYRGLKDGDSPDPFVVKKAETFERFWKQNFDYQALITIPDDYAKKQIFISEFGMDTFMSSQMTALENAYKLQRYTNKMECIHGLLSSENMSLMQPAQQVSFVQAGDQPTADELRQFILSLTMVKKAMVIGPQSSAFNIMKFPDIQDASRLKLLLRVGYKDYIEQILMSNVYHDEKLNIDLDIVEVPDFGGITYLIPGTSNPAYPVYDTLGSVIGFASTEGATTPEYQKEELDTLDPHADVVAILADRGVIFEARQNSYEVEPIRNPRGKYTNFWASSPGNTIAIDRLYNYVVFTKTVS